MTLASLFRRLFAPKKPPRRKSAARPGLEALEDRWVPATLTVGSGQSFATINAAYSMANPGDTIKVFAGTYQEQVTLSKKVALVAADPGTDKEVILAPAGLNGSIVEVNNGATGVVVKGFKIDGGGNAAGGIQAGVRVEGGASATVRQDHITGLYNGTNNQAGYGVEVGGSNDNGATYQAGVAKVLSNTIDGYQKGGVLVAGSSSSAQVSNNTVTGAGLVNLVAQNGIQVGNGAQGNVTFNTVTQNSYGNTAVDNFTATGILVISDTASVVVGQNEVNSNEVGLYLFSVSNTVVTNNDLSHNGSVGGLLLQGGSNVTITHNQADYNGSDGIYVLNSTGVNVFWNEALGNTNNGSTAFQGQHVQGNGNGIVIDGGSGNNIKFDASLVNASNGIVLVNTTGNTISYSVSAFNQGDGILLLGATNNTIHTNLVLGNQGTGIFLDSASTGNTIDNNVIADNGDGSFAQQLGVNGNNNTWQNAIITTNGFACFGLDDGSSY
jgi:parallel beta-helix repeat protein